MAFSYGSAAKVYAGGYNLTTFLSSAGIPLAADTGEVSAFGSTAKAYIAGLKDGTFSAEGYYDGSASAVDVVVSGALGVADTVFCYLPAGDAVGAYGYGFLGIDTAYEVQTPVDGVAAVSMEAQASGGGERILSFHALGAEAASGTGTSMDNAAASSNGGSAYLQVTASSVLTSLDVIIQGSTTGAWAGEETTLASFTQITATPGKERITFSGTVKRYLRAKWTLVGTSATFFVGVNRAA